MGRASVASSTRSVESDYLSPGVSNQDNYSPPKLRRELRDMNVSIECYV